MTPEQFEILRQMRASPACLALIKRHEDEAGFLAGRCSRLKAYLCPAGIWTVGWGHTRNVDVGIELTPEMADALLVEDVGAVEVELAAVFPGIEFTQGQWDALVSLCFNLRGGPRMLPTRAPKMTAAIRRREWPAAAAEFLDMDKARDPETGEMRPLTGLTKRRAAEAALFLS